MKLILHIILLIFYITTINSSLYNDIKDNVISLLTGPFRKESLRNGPDGEFDAYKVTRTQHPEDIDDDFNEDDKEPKINDVDNEKDGRQSSEERIRKPKLTKRINSQKKPNYFLNFEHNQRIHPDSEDKIQTRLHDDLRDLELAQSKAQILKLARHGKVLGNVKDVAIAKTDFEGIKRYHMDPVLNLVRSRDERRAASKEDSETEDSSSSSREMRDWKDEFKEQWTLKKFEALNASAPKGDVVNMVAARPWGVPCGDPNQHDMPWGSCMLAPECESEFRIYRGDYFCGRSEFVCCALQVTNYDLYQGFDVSFDDKSLSTDSEEKKNAGKNSREKKKRHRIRERKKRRQERLRRKRKIKRNIRKIVKEIKKILNKLYRNGTSQRRKKTKLLKKFIKDLKKRYRHDRQSVKELHEEQMITIDTELMNRLNQIREMNQEFMKNSTFRDIVVNGTMTKKQARMLVEAYPDLSRFLNTRRSVVLQKLQEDKPKDYLDYDIEYGYMYY